MSMACFCADAESSARVNAGADARRATTTKSCESHALLWLTDGRRRLIRCCLATLSAFPTSDSRCSSSTSLFAQFLFLFALDNGPLCLVLAVRTRTIRYPAQGKSPRCNIITTPSPSSADRSASPALPHTLHTTTACRRPPAAPHQLTNAFAFSALRFSPVLTLRFSPAAPSTFACPAPFPCARPFPLSCARACADGALDGTSGRARVLSTLLCMIAVLESVIPDINDRRSVCESVWEHRRTCTAEEHRIVEPTIVTTFNAQA